MMLPDKIGPFQVTPKATINKNRAYAECEPEIVFDAGVGTVKVNLKRHGAEILLFLAGQLLGDEKLSKQAEILHNKAQGCRKLISETLAAVRKSEDHLANFKTLRAAAQALKNTRFADELKGAISAEQKLVPPDVLKDLLEKDSKSQAKE